MEENINQPEKVVQLETVIRRFLKDNLKILINNSDEIDFGDKYGIIEVELYLGSELIDKASCSIR